MSEGRIGDRAVFFLLGAAAGSVAALLMAPASGARTRRRLVRKGEQAADYLIAAGKDLIDRCEDLYERSGEVVEMPAASCPASIALCTNTASTCWTRLKLSCGAPSCPRRADRFVLRLQRRGVSRERQDIVVGEMGGHLLHQRRGAAAVLVALEVVELARDVDGVEAGNARHVADSLQIVAVADGALDTSAGSAVGRQLLSFLDAAFRDIGHESGVGIAALGARGILRQFDNAVAQRLAAASGKRQAHAAFGADVTLRHGARFHELHPDNRL